MKSTVNKIIYNPFKQLNRYILLYLYVFFGLMNRISVMHITNGLSRQNFGQIGQFAYGTFFSNRLSYY